jgi:hypothetical protein
VDPVIVWGADRRDREEALIATLRSAPDPIRPEVTRLVARLRARWSTEEALRIFADDLDDATGDLVAANLILGARRRGAGVASVLERRGSAENSDNFETAIVPLLKHAISEVVLPYDLDGITGFQQRARVGVVSAVELINLFAKLAWHPEYEANIKAFRGFIQKATDDKKITDWAVVWPWPNTGGRLFDIPELGGDVSIVKRKRRTGRIDFVGSDRKHRAAARPIALGEHVASLGESSTRGVVLVSLVPDGEPDDPATPINRKDLVGLISIAAPAKSVPRSNLIQWTVVNSAKPDDVVVDQPSD